MTVTIGSLFSGIGGLEYGLEAGLAAAGVPTRTLWQVEQNDYARAVLARHWPHAERYTDVRDITASSVAPVDLICGGFPCQDLSYAGKGAGLAGERSGLFFEMARIICELQPRIAVMENVPAITTRGLDVVLRTLAALGYDARWGGLRASEVGAPHRRERWFCVAWLADDDRQRSNAGARLPARSAGSGRPDPHRGNRSGSGMADTNRRGQESRRHLAGVGWVQWWQPDSPPRPRAGTRPTESAVGGDADGLPCRLDLHRWPAPPGPQHAHEPPRTRPRQPHDRERLKGLGNAVVPQCAAEVGRWIADELLEVNR